MKNYYHKIDSRLLEFDLDSIELKFGLWITKKEFGQRLNYRNPLPLGQFYMSVRVVAHDINITDKIARRLIHQFTKLNIIRLVYSSKNPKKGSIYEYLVYAEENQLESDCREALKQIKDCDYPQKLRNAGFHKILKYGIACQIKTCKVLVEI